MKKNKIEGIIPFNDFFFRSCYYHQLISGLSCFGIKKEQVLLNAITLINDNYVVGGGGELDESKLEKTFGYKRKYCNIDKSKLIKSIDAGNPLIVGVDCFYLESRPDSYKIQHMAHYILVYGYDLEKETLNIVDHQYRNSMDYTEKIVSLENILYANKMYRKGVLKRRLSCYILEKVKKSEKYDFGNSFDNEKLNHNREYALKNLDNLRMMLKSDFYKIDEKIDEIILYLINIREFYLILSEMEIFRDEHEGKDDITALMSGYYNLLSVFWKVRAQINYEYLKKRRDIVLKKLDEIEANENKVYAFLKEERAKYELLQTDRY